MQHCRVCGRTGTHSRGLCARCYSRARRAGELDDVGLPARTPDVIAAETRRRRKIGTRRPTSHGYIEAWDGSRWVLEQRYVMAKQLRRPLRPGETVRHRNGNSLDNDPTNLELRHNSEALGGNPYDAAVMLVQNHRDIVQSALAANAGALPHDDPGERAAIIFVRACDRTGLTRTRLAKELGVDTSYLSQMMRRRRPVPTAILIRVLDLAGTPLEAILPE